MYDASKGGLAQLVRLERSQQNRLSAKLLRAYARQYSPEYKWVRDMYERANKLEKEKY